MLARAYDVDKVQGLTLQEIFIISFDLLKPKNVNYGQMYGT